MGLVRLTYASRLMPELGPSDLWDILKTAREHNSAAFITGMLCYDAGSFLQCLEGERDTVNALYRAIIADSRHSDVTLLEYGEIEHRIFSRWAMAYLKPEAITEQL
ncbi:MAG: BLUF domain-containing protein, partial [Coriobacteriia bacterium]|nr:BLUF domain-containing protein [Coriobacteriia bacterium]